MKTKSLTACAIAALLSSMIMANVQAYQASGSLPQHGVDYWWISDVEKDDLVLLTIEASTTYSWESRLSYSNLTVIETISEPDTHIYEFYATKTDNYLVRLYSPTQSLSYTIRCSHSVRIPGDINGDCRVDHKDLLLLASAYGSEVEDPNYIPEADINGDGKVDHKDLLILASNYGKGT